MTTIYHRLRINKVLVVKEKDVLNLVWFYFYIHLHFSNLNYVICAKISRDNYYQNTDVCALPAIYRAMWFTLYDVNSPLVALLMYIPKPVCPPIDDKIEP